MATASELSKGDSIELTEEVGFAPAGSKGMVIQVFEDGQVMISTMGKSRRAVGRQTAIVDASQLRLID